MSPRALAWLLAVATLACSEPDDPVHAGRKFIRLARRGECRNAFSLYTAASQRNLEAQSAKYRKNTPYQTDANEAWHLHCHVFANYVARTARETFRSGAGDSAVITVMQRTGTRFPIIPFLTDPLKERDVTFSMIREDGAWKVAAPYVETEDPRRRELPRPRRAGRHAGAGGGRIPGLRALAALDAVRGRGPTNS